MLKIEQQQRKLTQHDASLDMKIVLNTDFPDPSVLKLSDSEFVAYATERIWQGKQTKIQVASAQNPTDWTYHLHDALKETPRWAAESNLHTWAPFVRLDKSGIFNLYYCISTNPRRYDGSMAISRAVSDKPDRGFVDRSKKPIIYGKFGNELTANIDPYVGPDPDGQLAMIWGSAGLPIMRKKLTPDGSQFEDPVSSPEVLLTPKPNSFYERVIEGAFLIDEFLLYSGANCFGNGNKDLETSGRIPKRLKHLGLEKPGEYAVLQARLNPKTNQFERKQVPVLIEGNQQYKNPGNASVIMHNGETIIYFHVIDRNNQYFPGTRYNRRIMAAQRLVKRQGWLHAKNGILK